MKNGDEASPSIILTDRALLVRMPIPLNPCGAFGSNFVYLCILTLHCSATGDEASSSSLNENAHNSWTAWYILFIFCILMYFNIAKPLVCKTVMRLRRASFWPITLF